MSFVTPTTPLVQSPLNPPTPHKRERHLLDATMTSGFQLTSMVLTPCQTASDQLRNFDPPTHPPRLGARLLFCDLGGGGGLPSPGPPTRIGKIFLGQKVKFIEGARNLRPILRAQSFLGPLTPLLKQ